MVCVGSYEFWMRIYFAAPQDSYNRDSTVLQFRAHGAVSTKQGLPSVAYREVPLQLTPGLFR